MDVDVTGRRVLSAAWALLSHAPARHDRSAPRTHQAALASLYINLKQQIHIWYVSKMYSNGVMSSTRHNNVIYVSPSCVASQTGPGKQPHPLAITKNRGSLGGGAGAVRWIETSLRSCSEARGKNRWLVRYTNEEMDIHS